MKPEVIKKIDELLEKYKEDRAKEHSKKDKYLIFSTDKKEREDFIDYFIKPVVISKGESKFTQQDYLRQLYLLLLNHPDYCKSMFGITLKNVWMTAANAIEDPTERLTHICLWNTIKQAILDKKQFSFENLYAETKNQLLLLTHNAKIGGLEYVGSLLEDYKTKRDERCSGRDILFEDGEKRGNFITQIETKKNISKGDPILFLKSFYEVLTSKKDYKEYVEKTFGVTLHAVWMVAANCINDPIQRLVHCAMWESAKQSILDKKYLPFETLQLEATQRLLFKVEINIGASLSKSEV